MKKIGDYWFDENGNSWDADRYGEAEAEEVSKTLTDCYGCHNCCDCQSCDDCRDCDHCYGCHDCCRCSGCRDCEFIEGAMGAMSVRMV